MLRITDVVKHLLVINVLIFLAGEFLVNTNMLALHFPASQYFQPYQIATHFFMHGGFMHLFFNMFALVMFGSALESFWGPKKFLYFYFICAFGAAAIHMGYTWWDISQVQQAIRDFAANPSFAAYNAFFEDVPLDAMRSEYPAYTNNVASIESAIRTSTSPEIVSQGVGLMNEWLGAKINTPIVGASGAIYGLLLAFGMYFPNAELMLIFLPIPIKAKYFIPILMVVELFLGVNHFSWDNIAHFAHLGGALTGFLLILYWRKFGSRFDNTGR